MKRTLIILITTVVLAACGGKTTTTTTTSSAELIRLKKQRADLDEKIQKLEANTKDTGRQLTAVRVMEVQPGSFHAYIDVQSQILGDENVNATPQINGSVTNVLVHVGQRVNKGQTLATLDAASVEQQIQAQDAQLSYARTIYEKQQKLYAQNIGSEIQLLQAKANYEALSKQRQANVAQRNMYRIISPINGVVDQVNIKVGDAAAPGGGGGAQGIRVVNDNKLKAEANLGENYLGKVKIGDPVTILLPDLNDSIHTNITYVSQAIDPISRAFSVQVRLGSNSKLHPNMSCRLRITNYSNADAMVVPISVIQKTASGEMLYIADQNMAKAVMVMTGRNANGNIEILSGLKAGDKVITEGYNDLDNGEQILVK